MHISMQDLIDFAKDEDVEIYKDRRASSFSDEDLFKDFVHKFWISSAGNKDLRDLERRINQITAQARNESNTVLLLSILAVLIMPFCENDERELHGNDYYGHLLPFLYSHHFVDKASYTNLLANIKLDEIWDSVNHWATDRGLPFHSSGVLAENGTKQYVRSLMRESILSPSKLQKFCFIFDHAGLVPRTNIENDRLLSAFSNYYSSIGISPTKLRQLTSKEFRDYIISVLRIEYDNWDGTTRVKERDRHTGKTRVEAGNTAYPLLLQMDFDTNSLNCSFAFQLYCSDIDDMDYMTFVADTNKKKYPEIYIKNDGYANQLFHLEDSELKTIFANRQGAYAIHEEADNSLRARHVVTDYYILRLYKNRYIATNEFVKGAFYFVVIRHDAIDDFSAWLKDNAADLITDGALGGYYSVFRIEHAVSELPNKNNLRFKKEIRCKSINNIEVKTDSDTDTVYLSTLLPAQFDISGVDIFSDKIYAVSVNTPHRYSSELKYDHQKNLWILKVFTNFFQRQTEFQLFCNEAPIPYGRTFMFKEFSLPKHFKELPLDQWGGMDDVPLSMGLELPASVIGRNLINWTMLKMQMQKANPGTIHQGKYLENDYLLYAITSASFESSRKIITMQWIKEIRDRIANEFENEDSCSLTDKYSLSNALADYFRMGYINYSYTDSGLSISANRPTLILLTPKFYRTVRPGLQGKSIVSISCVEGTYKCLLTGGRTNELVRKIEKYQQPLGFKVEYLEKKDPLQPQTIYIHASERAVFRALAEKCNLLYQDNIYANALLESLPTVGDYISFKKQVGDERDLFFVPSRRVIDYVKMAEIYPERRARGQAIFNHEIDKEDFNPKSDVVTFFPGTRDETTIMIDEGRMVEVDKYWGHFVGMYKSGAKILLHDPDRAQISLPHQFRLPLLYARALTLMIGTTPDSVFGSRTYSIGENPFTFGSRPEAILNKLGQ